MKVGHIMAVEGLSSEGRIMAVEGLCSRDATHHW